jgi:NTP pyrophosphatase (non-canonical NTP hydrolase)
MNKIDALELLGILQEECAEVIKVISKIRRFGLCPRDSNTGIDYDNLGELKQEIGDILCLIEMLQNNTNLNITDEYLQKAKLAKFEKLKKYLNG